MNNVSSRLQTDFVRWLKELNDQELCLLDFEYYFAEEFFDDLLLVYRKWMSQRKVNSIDSKLHLRTFLLNHALSRSRSKVYFRDVQSQMAIKALFVLELPLNEAAKSLGIRPNYVKFLVREYFNSFDKKQKAFKCRQQLRCELFVYDYLSGTNKLVSERFSKLAQKNKSFSKKLQKMWEDLEQLKESPAKSTNVEKINAYRLKFLEKVNSKFFDPWMSPLFSWGKILLQTVLMCAAVYILVNFPSGDVLRNEYYPQFIERLRLVKTSVHRFLGVPTSEKASFLFSSETNKLFPSQKVFRIKSDDLLKASQNIEYILSQFQVKTISSPIPGEGFRESYEIDFYIKKDDYFSFENALSTSKLTTITIEEVKWVGELQKDFVPIKIQASLE